MIAERHANTIEEFKRRLLPAIGDRARRIILYGSRARGTATTESDSDLLVMEREPVLKRQEMWRLRRAISDVRVPVDVWVMGETEFEEAKGVIGGLAYPAHKYGVTLYENA